MKLKAHINDDGSVLYISYCMNVRKYGLTNDLIEELREELYARLKEAGHVKFGMSVPDWENAHISDNHVIPRMAVSIRLTQFVALSGSEIVSVTEHTDSLKQLFQYAVVFVERWATENGLAD